MSDQTFSIAVRAQLKHGLLWEALQSRGWSQRQGAEFLGMSAQEFGRWINLKNRPRKLFKERERKLFELTGKTIEELWPPEVFSDEFLAAPKVLSATRDVPIRALLGSAAPALSAGEAAEQEELKRVVAEALCKLPPQQAKVVSAYLFEEMTFEEIGRKLRLSRGRANQIYHNAIRRLQHPARCRKLMPWAGIEE